MTNSHKYRVTSLLFPCLDFLHTVSDNPNPGQSDDLLYRVRQVQGCERFTLEGLRAWFYRRRHTSSGSVGDPRNFDIPDSSFRMQESEGGMGNYHFHCHSSSLLTRFQNFRPSLPIVSHNYVPSGSRCLIPSLSLSKHGHNYFTPIPEMSLLGLQRNDMLWQTLLPPLGHLLRLRLRAKSQDHHTFPRPLNLHPQSRSFPSIHRQVLLRFLWGVTWRQSLPNLPSPTLLHVLLSRPHLKSPRLKRLGKTNIKKFWTPSPHYPPNHLLFHPLPEQRRNSPPHSGRTS